MPREKGEEWEPHGKAQMPQCRGSVEVGGGTRKGSSTPIIVELNSGREG